MFAWLTTPRTPPAQRPVPPFAVFKAMSPAEQAAALAAPDSARWIESAARYGLVEAQVLLGQLHLDGRIAPSEPGRAYRWFAAAAAAGFPPGINMQGRCLERGWGVAVDLSAAAACFARAADAGLDWGQYNRAQALLHGRGVPPDPAAARTWFQRAADQGHAKSMNMLGRILDAGWGCPSDPAAAATWFQRAAQAGDFRGQFNWATILAGRGDRDGARHWFAQAVAHGTPDFLHDAARALDGSGDPLLQALADQARGGSAPSSSGGAGPYASHASEPSRLPR